MNPEKETELVNKYPQIFRDHGGNPAETCMAWGICVGGGWYDLIDCLCENIMASNPPPSFKAEQVKEKFGGLRFYYSGGNLEIDGLVSDAESESHKTCENCGSKDSVTTGGKGWISTLCDNCRNPKTK